MVLSITAPYVMNYLNVKLTSRIRWGNLMPDSMKSSGLH